MRSVGDFRAALRGAASELGHGGGTWRDLAARAQVGYEAARRTAVNMQRAGELVVVGEVRVPGTNRPMTRLASSDVVAAPMARSSTVGWLDYV